jgi:hypothetical protein
VDGTYSLSLPTGDYTMWVQGSDVWAGGSWCNAYYLCWTQPGTTITVTTSAVTTTNITLRPYPTISGTVTGTGGTPLSGIYVSSSISGTGVTAADGTYTAKVIPGVQTIAFTDYTNTWANGYYGAGGWVLSVSSGTTINAGATPTTGIDVQMPHLRTVSGTVTDETGAPLPGAVVTPWASGSSFTPTTTAADGTFSLRLASSVTWKLALLDPSSIAYAGWYASNASGFTTDSALATGIALAGSDVTGLAIHMKDYPRIKGKLTGPAGQGLASQWITAWGVNGTVGTYSEQTAADGTYWLQAPAGQYHIGVTAYDPYAPGYYSATGWKLYESDASVVTTTTADVSGINLQIPSMQTISGKFTDIEGSPIQYVTVTTEWSSAHYQTGYSQADGTWSVKVPPGSWTLQLSQSYQTKAGWVGGGVWVATQGAATPYAVSSSSIPNVNVVLPWLPRLYGVVHDAQGAPIAGVAVQLGVMGMTPPMYGDTSRADGSYRIFLANPLSYYLMTNAGGDFLSTYEEGSFGTSDVVKNFTLHRYAIYTGTITDTSGNPVAGISVTPYAYPNGAYGGSTDANGHYKVRALGGSQLSIAYTDGSYNHVNGYLTANGFGTSNPLVMNTALDTVRDDAITIPTYRHFTGHLLNPDGAPLSSGSLSLYGNGSSPSPVANTWVSGDGSFDLRVAPGSWYMTISSPYGYASGWVGENGFNYRPSPAGAFTMPDADRSMDLVVPKSLTVSGTVTSGATPLGNVEVDLLLDGAAYAYTTTDQSGHWSIPAAPGAYIVGVYDPSKKYSHGWIGPSGFTLDPDNAELVAISMGDIANLNVSLPLNHTVAGTYRNTSGTKSSGVYVEAWVNGSYYGSTYTKSGGAWSLPVASGKVTFWSYPFTNGNAPGWRTSSSLTANPASAAATTVGSSSVTGVAIVAPLAHWFYGTTRVKSGSSYVDFADTFVEAVAYGTAASFAWSNNYGDYSLPVLSSTYLLWADTIGQTAGQPAPVAGGWYRSGSLVTPDSTLATKVSASALDTKIVFSMWPAAHFTGTIRDDAGYGLANGFIAVFSNGYLYDRAAADSIGNFSITVPPGTYKLGYYDDYGRFAEGWLGDAGYTADYANAKSMVMAAGGSTDASIVLPSADPPSAPTDVTAIPYHLSALVSWTPPATTPDRPIIHSTVTASPGGRQCTATGTSWCMVTGLADGTPYTFTVTATTNVGSSPVSAASGAVTPRAVPGVVGAPAAQLIAGPSTSATVTWSAPAANGSAITGYTVTASSGPTCVPDPATSTTCQFDNLPEGWTTFTVAAANANGTGPSSAPSTPIAVDVTGPSVTAPSTSLRSGLSMSGTAVPVAVAWTASDAVSGLASTSLGVQVGGTGDYTPLALASGTATSWTGTIAAASALRLQAGATDLAGNPPTLAPGTSFGLAVTQESGSGTAKSGAWTTQSTSSALGGKLRYTTAKGAYETYTFTGRAVAWVARKGTAEGSAAVYLDGKLVATISLHATSTTMRWIAWQKSGLTLGKHVVKIVCLGTSGHARIDVDALIAIK